MELNWKNENGWQMKHHGKRESKAAGYFSVLKCHTKVKCWMLNWIQRHEQRDSQLCEESTNVFVICGKITHEQCLITYIWAINELFG